MSFKETIDFIWTTWESGGVVMFPLILVAFLIYSVAVHLFLSLTRRSFRNLDDETLIKWVEDPKKSEGEVGRIIRFTQDGVFELSDIYSRFSEVFASCLPFFERRLVYLNTLIATAPLLGLLGTVMGMLITFKGLSIGGGKLLDVVASGISEALHKAVLHGLLIPVYKHWQIGP